MVCNAVNVVRGSGMEKMKEYIPGPEAQKTIGAYLNHRAFREGIKYVFPAGAPACNIAAALLDQPDTRSVHDDKKSKEVQVLQADIERLRAENERLHAEHERIKGLILIDMVSKRSFIPFYGSLPSYEITQVCAKPESLVTGHSPQIDSSQQ